MTVISGKKRIAIVGLVTAAALAVAPRAADAQASTPTIASADNAPAEAVHYYLSLGDSLAASKQANGDSTHGYAEQLFSYLKANDPTLRLVKLGCGGETTHSMISGNPCDYPHGSQLAEAVSFLHAHRPFVSLVTLDIGGNDVLLCVFELDQDCLNRALPSASNNLATILSALRQAGGRDVRIVGMNYYDPFLAFWFGSPTAAQLTEQMVVQSDEVLRSVYGAAADPLADVESAFSTTDFTPQPDGIPLNVQRICQWTWMCTSSPDVHPNTTGYGVIAQSFVAVVP